VILCFCVKIGSFLEKELVKNVPRGTIYLKSAAYLRFDRNG